MVDALQEPEAGHDDLGLRALTTGAAIGSSDNKTLAVAALARQLPEHQRGRALDIIAREPNEGSRLGGVERIAAALPPALRERAVAVAGDFRQPELRAEALAAVAATLDEPQRSETYVAALGAAQEALRPRELGNPGAQTLEAARPSPAGEAAPRDPRAGEHRRHVGVRAEGHPRRGARAPRARAPRLGAREGSRAGRRRSRRRACERRGRARPGRARGGCARGLDGHLVRADRRRRGRSARGQATV